MTTISEHTSPAVSDMARWYCQLNHGEWPVELGKPKEWYYPYGHGWWRRMLWPVVRFLFRGFLDHELEFVQSIIAMRVIKAVIGAKETLRFHHTDSLSHTNEQFEKWWAENGRMADKLQCVE